MHLHKCKVLYLKRSNILMEMIRDCTLHGANQGVLMCWESLVQEQLTNWEKQAIPHIVGPGCSSDSFNSLVSKCLVPIQLCLRGKDSLYPTCNKVPVWIGANPFVALKIVRT
jgi:hypothetical protein